MSSDFLIPDHTFVRQISEREDFQLWETRVRGVAATTRLFTGVRLPLVLRSSIEGVLQGRPFPATPGLNPRLADALTGVAVRAGLGGVPGLPPLLAAGLATRSPGAMTEGVPYFSVAWAPGTPLSVRTHGLSREERERVLSQVVELLVELHRRQVVFGDLKPANVVVDADAVHLIDLETLRHVPRLNEGVTHCMTTAEYGAPEVEQYNLLFLSSDIYSLGMTARWVLQAGVAQGLPVGGRWESVIAACLRPGPLDRPQASAILSFLQEKASDLPTWTGEPEARTHRVPDQASPSSSPEAGGPVTARVADARPSVERPGPVLSAPIIPTAAPVPDPPRPAPPVVGGRGVLRVLVGLAGFAGLVFILAMLGAGLWVYSRRSAADEQADAVMERLALRQTDPAQNAAIKLDVLQAEAEAAGRAWSTPRTLSVVALTRVLASKWHYAPTRWNADRWRGDAAALTAAIAAGQSAETQLAAAYLYLAICKYNISDASVSVEDACQRSEAAADWLGAQPGVAGWMWMDAQWAATMSESRWATRVKASAPGTSAALYQRALARCQGGLTRRTEGVNSEELLEDCLEIGAASGAFDFYLKAADALLTMVEPRGGKELGKLRLQIIQAADPACGDKDAVALKSLVPPYADITSVTEQKYAFCRYVGAVALGCGASAEAFWPCSSTDPYRDFGYRCYYYIPDSTIPWGAASSAAASPVRSTCPLR